MFKIFQRLFSRDRSENNRLERRRRVHITVRALVGVELKRGHLIDLSPRGARIHLRGLREAPEWVDLECTTGIQRGLVRWSRLGEGDQWEGGIEFE